MTTDRPLLRKEMPELDTLRGLAVLLVFLYHGLFWSIPQQSMTPAARAWTSVFRFGWSGVQLFFVLSGFLITGILFRSKERPRYYRNFYLRRVLRIFPACMFLIVALLTFGAISWKFALVAFAFAANLAPLLHVTLEYPPLWSLAVEEQFYAIWPAVVRRWSVRSIAIIASIVFVASPIVRALAFPGGDGSVFYTWFNLDGLALGAILAVVVRTGRAQFARLGAASLIAGVVAAALVVTAGRGSRTNIIGAALAPTMLYCLFAALLAFALLIGTSKRSALVRIAPLQWLGDISYGLYLIHVVAFTAFDHLLASTRFAPATYTSAAILVRLAIAGGSAIAVAAASRYWYEAYFLSLKDAVAAETAPATVSV